MDIEVTTLEGQLMRMNPSDLNIITSSITLISMEICPSSEQQLFHMRVALQSFNQRLTRLTMLQSAQENSIMFLLITHVSMPIFDHDTTNDLGYSITMPFLDGGPCFFG